MRAVNMYKIKKKRGFGSVFLFLILSIILLLFRPLETWAELVQVTNIKVESDSKYVLVSYKISGAFDEILNQRIESGLPVEFVFKLKVIMHRPPWIEKNLVEKKIVNRVTYDNITGKYTVNIKVGDEEKEFVFTDLEKMQEKMVYIKKLPVIKLDRLIPHREYSIKIKGEFKEKLDFWFPLNFLLSFFSKNFNKGWKISDTFSIDKIEKLKQSLRNRKE